MKLVALLESEAGYTLQDEELILTTFENLNSITRVREEQGSKLGKWSRRVPES
jgi:hypothetical protein